MNQRTITTYAINELPPEIQERVRQDWKNSARWDDLRHEKVKAACESRVTERGYPYAPSLSWGYVTLQDFHGPIPDICGAIDCLYADPTDRQILRDWLNGIDPSKFHAEIKVASIGTSRPHLVAEVVYDGDLSREMEQRLRDLSIRINLDVVALQADLEELATELETELGADTAVDADLMAQEIEFTADGNQFFYNKEGVS